MPPSPGEDPAAAETEIPEGWIVDRDGNPTSNPKDGYDGGALQTMGGHKGYCLSLAVNLLAGAFTAGKTVNPDGTVNRNNMTSIFVSAEAYGLHEEADGIASSYLAWVKYCIPRDPDSPVLIPGEPEAREKQCRLESGGDVPDGIWRQVLGAAAVLGLTEQDLI